MNVAMGGSADSSYSMETIGNVWFFSGRTGLALYQMIVALYLGLLLLGRPGPLRFVVAVLVIRDFVVMNSTYPDVIAGHIQELVSLGVAALVLATAPRTQPGASPVVAGRLQPYSSA
jgi:hypothetical protein